MLLVADASRTESLCRGLGESATAVSNPYDALLEMSHRPWRAVILSADQSDFAGLCRATRRLQNRARLFAVCLPEDEVAVRTLVGECIDDYFIDPPTPTEFERMRVAAESPSSGAGVVGAGALSPRQVAEMISATRNLAALESCLARIVGEFSGVNVHWTDAQNVTPPGVPLLTTSTERPRALVGEAKELSAAALLAVAAVREMLPALTETARRAESLHRLAVTDHLTGAYNRRYFYQVTDDILQKLRGRRATVLLWDIDDFKRYNDTYGHAAGDEILRETAALMKRISRSQDIVARIGGDEFAALFWDAESPRSPDSQPLQTAYALADRFRRAVAHHAFTSLGPEARGVLSISGGLAQYPQDGTNVRELLRSADAALKHAKKTGKNVILVGQK
jgi:diguanylate cyclase (GGDEF)-like protein